MDDDEESVISEAEIRNVTVDFPESVKDLENDDEYDGECGYWLITLLRGRTTGRKLKRNIFKVGLSQGLSGFILLCITVYIQRNYAYESYFNTFRLGATLMSLMWLVSFPSVLAGIFSMLIVKFWPSLVTNRQLIINLTRMYMVIMFMLLVSVCWCIASLIVTFNGIRFMVSVI